MPVRQAAASAKKGTGFNLQAALKAARKHWAAAQERGFNEGGFAEFDDGRYVLQLQNITIGRSNSSDRLQADFTWKFKGGEYGGKEYHSYQGLDTGDGWYYFGNDLGRLGYDVEAIDPKELAADLPEIFKEIKKDKPICNVSLRTKGDFQNARILEVGVEPEEEDDEEEQDEEPRTKKKRKVVQEEDEEEESSDDEEEDDEEEEPKPRKRRAVKKTKDEDDEEEEDAEDEEESDDDEEEEEPKPRAKKRKPPVEEEDEEEDDEEEIAVVVGSTVKVKTNAGIKKAEVLEVHEKDEKVKIKTAEGKTLTLSAEKIISVEEPPRKTKKR